MGSIKHMATTELWDLASKVLTELSRRDEVSYRIKATDESFAEKLASLTS
jgi:hypothetical protein